MGLAATGGGRKKITHYKFTNAVNNGDFTQSFAITAVADVSKSEVFVKGVYGDLAANFGGGVMLHLASTISVEYAIFTGGTGSAGAIAFSVVEYY